MNFARQDFMRVETRFPLSGVNLASQNLMRMETKFLLLGVNLASQNLMLKVTKFLLFGDKFKLESDVAEKVSTVDPEGVRELTM